MCSGTSSRRQRHEARAGRAGSRARARHGQSLPPRRVSPGAPRRILGAMRDRDRLVPARPARARPSGAHGRPPRRPTASCRSSCSTRGCSTPAASRRANRAWFLLASLRELRAALRDRGGELVVRARPAGARAARAGRARRARRPSTSPPTSRRSRWRATAASTRRSTASRCAATPATSSPTSARRARADGRPFSVFSPFWRALGAAAAARGARRAARARPCRPALDAGALPDAPAPEAAEPFAARRGRRARAAAPLAGARPRRLRRAPRPARRRHLGALALPALRLRLRARGRAARARPAAARAPRAFVRQLAWRDFYAHVLLHHPGNARHAYKPQFDALEWADDAEALAAWCEGRTGFPVVDAGMRQLRHAGWMHNRARLIVASFLTKDLHIDWRARRGATSCATCCAATRRRTTATGSGSPRSASTPRPYFRRMYNPVGAAAAPRSRRRVRAPLVPRAARRPAREARRAVDDERGRAGGGRLRDRARLPGADRRPQARARAGDGALPRGPADAGANVAAARWRDLYVQRDQPPGVPPLHLTGERTLPDVPEENYWYRRHLVVYEWIAAARARPARRRPRLRRGLRRRRARPHRRVRRRRRRQPRRVRARAAEVHGRARRASSAT